MLVIVALASLVLRDDTGLPWTPPLPPWATVGVTLGAFAALALLTHAILWSLGRRMDRLGSVAAIRRSDAVLAWSRVTAAALHLAAIFGLGWLDAVRSMIGDVVLADEAAAVVPFLLFFAAGWWSIHPIDRRVREALMLGRLDRGLSVQPTPSRAAFVVNAVRHHLAVAVVPVLLLLAWDEGVQRLLHRSGWPGPRGPDWISDRVWKGLRQFAHPAARLLGVAGVFALAPLLLRHIWDTVRLGPGELRDSIVELCRAGRVRVRELLVWRTGGTMLNGAVIGLFPGTRYILLTDALLELLTPGQVRAVAAHEIAHVRRRHMLWLGLAVLASVFGAALLADRAGRTWLPQDQGERWFQACATGASLAAGLLVFGFASRRFEWQADAFAVAHLSGHRDGADGAAVVTPESVAEMTGALQAVADLNHVPVHRFSFRHGSIADRQRRLARLAWQRIDRLPADRGARRVKRSTILGVIVVVAGVAADAGLW
ncbi:MAG: M48 family metalloprotease [Phycisphaerales bacterium]